MIIYINNIYFYYNTICYECQLYHLATNSPIWLPRLLFSYISLSCFIFAITSGFHKSSRKITISLVTNLSYRRTYGFVPISCVSDPVVCHFGIPPVKMSSHFYVQHLLYR